jgi:DNA-binding response OmpR family regulator
MADVKKVLVVDDHFEMLELLRSMLELSNEEYEVLAVPSAEEGWLEMQRTPFDLVITDVRLPGMSGFDFVRRMRKRKRDTPVIMITAYSSAEGQKEADELGVMRYFPKPLDTDAVLLAVQVALHGMPVAAAGVEEMVGETAVSQDVRKRLKTLRTDTGAGGLMLSTLDGKMIFQMSDGQPLELAGLSQALAQTIQNSFALAGYLASDAPNTIQYHAGEKIELYCANIGQRYFLTIFFDVQSRRGRIGTIWVFTQRAIKDLLEMLPDVEQPLGAGVPAVPQQVNVAAAPKPAVPAAAKPKPEPETAVAPPVTEDWLDLDTADLDDLFGDSGGAVSVAGDLDSFWDDALTDQPSTSAKGMSLEEARKQGLFPADLDLGGG